MNRVYNCAIWSRGNARVTTPGDAVIMSVGGHVAPQASLFIRLVNTMLSWFFSGSKHLGSGLDKPHVFRK